MKIVKGKARKPKTLLTEEKKKEIAGYAYTLIQEKKYKSLKQIGDKFGIANETVRKVLLEYGVSTPNTKTVVNISPTSLEKAISKDYGNVEETVVTPPPVPVVVEQTTGKETFVGAEKVDVSRVVRCITCSERHSMPNLKDIFGTAVSSNEMFDFVKLQTKAEDFIKANITFNNGKALDSLELYITGLTMLTTAVIGACNKLQVNLTIMHYDRDTRSYKPQPMFSNFGIMSEPSPILTYLKGYKDFGAAYQYGCNLFELHGNFFMISIKYFEQLSGTVPKKSDYIFTDSFEDSYILFGNTCKEVKNKKGRVQVQLMNAKIENGIFSYTAATAGSLTKIYTNF